MSNDYSEIMVDFILAEEDVKGMDYCVFRLDDQFSILYFLHTAPRSISVSRYFYNSIPKLYGLMQDELGRASSFNTQNLTKSGILQVQAPPLSLTGKGVIIGFVDTGERVILLPVSKKPVNTRGCADEAIRVNAKWHKGLPAGQAGFIKKFVGRRLFAVM